MRAVRIVIQSQYASLPSNNQMHYLQLNIITANVFFQIFYQEVFYLFIYLFILRIK